MPILKSNINLNSEECRENRKRHEDLLSEINKAAEFALAGGSEASKKRHVERGKILPRDRINSLIDPGSPFLEIGLFAANDLYDNVSPSAGIICGDWSS